MFAGMLASAETIDVVADALERHGKPFSVIDPVSTFFMDICNWIKPGSYDSLTLG